MKKLFVFLFLTVLPLMASAQVKRTIDVVTAGTLSTLISDGEKYTIDELTLTGELNGSDLRLVREMVGCDYLGCQTSGKVTKLDLSGVRIVAGGEKYLDTRSICSSQNSCTNGWAFIYSSENDVLGNYLFAGCDKLQEIKLPNSITSIGDNVFHFGYGLKSLTIPKNVVSIGHSVIIFCENIESLNVEAGNTVFSSPAGSNAIIKGTTLVMGCNATVIPDGITTIGASAFEGVGKYGSSLTLPSTLTTIESRAFATSSFSNFVLPEGLKTIGEYAFGWTPVKSLSIPASVSSIGFRVLYGCQALESIVVNTGNANYDSREQCNAIIETASNTVIQGCKNTVIPQSVKTIGNSAFEQLYNLESFTIPSWITSIGDRAFADCWNMKDITSEIEDPSAVTMGRDVFSNYNQDMKRTLYVPSGTKTKYNAISEWKNGFSSIKEIGSNCITLHVNTPGSLSTLISDETKYTIDELILTGQLNGSDLLMIREMAGNGFDGKHIKEARLKVLDLSGVTFINDTEHAYVSFENDEHIDYPVYGKTDQFRFADGRGTHYVEANKIGKYAFTGCYKLQEIVLPSSITEIDERAFYYCTALSSLMVPASVTNIGSEAIAGCFSLASLTVESGNSTYSSPAASNAIVKGDCLIAGCSTTDFSRLGTISELAPYAFSRQEGMQVIKLPGSIKKIGDCVFLFCSELKDIYSYIETPFNVSQSTFYSINSECCLHVLSGTKSAYLAAEGWKDVFTEDRILEELSSGNAVNVAQAGTLSILLADPMQIEELTVTGNLNGTDFRLIREMAGNDYLGQPTNGMLKKLDLSGANIVAGGDMNLDADEVWSSHNSYAHWGGEYFHFNTQQNVLGNAMFAGCEKLVDIVLPKSITSIGNLAFFDCMNLESLVIPENVSSIGMDVFVECNKLSGISVADGNTIYSAPANCNVLMEGTTLMLAFGNPVIPEGTTAIGANAFKSYYGNPDFVVPEGVVSIGDNAFAWSNIKSISLPSTLKRIDPFAFSLTQLESITIPASVEFIGERILNHCSNLTKVTVASGNPVYDSRDNCNAIIETASNTLIQGCKTTVIPESVTAFGTTAFTECQDLTSITIPKSITQIGEAAFMFCARLKDVYSLIEKPFDIKASAFPQIGEYSDLTTTFHVPYGTKDAYLNAEGWKVFKDYIVEMVMTDEVAYTPNVEEKTVTVDGSGTGTKEVEIQSEVEIGGEKYSVTAIGEGAFENNETLEKVSIPETVEFIGDNAFAGCKNLSQIRIFAEEPIKLGSASAGTRGEGTSNVFAEVDMETCVLYVPAGSKEKYEQAEGWKEFKNIVEMGETAAITIGKSGKASYCGDKSLDFGYSDKVKAYIATGFDKDEGTIWLTRVKDVPAGVPVLIKGEANKTYDVPVTDSQNSYYTNMFVGNTSGEKMVIQETDGDKVNYYLSGDGTFKSVNKTANIGTNKCYLQLPRTFEAAATGATQTVKVGSIGKASFAAPVDLDFTNVSGLKAFTATGYDKSTKTIWLTRVMKVQKGEGVLLKGDPNSYEIPSAAVQSRYENMFVGNTSGDEIRVQETSEDGSQTNYYLSGKDGSFVSVSGYAKIGDNKCYLALPTSMVAVSSTRSAEDSYKFEEPEVIKMPIEFKSIGSEGDGTTAVKEVKSGEAKSDEWFTLQGQRVAKPGKGLYIKNGKVVIVR